MIAATAAAAVTAVLALLGNKVAAKAQKEVARGPDWQAHLEDVREWHEEQLRLVRDRADRDAALADKWKRKYWKLVAWVRGLLHRHPDERSRLPPELQDDL